MPALRVQIAEVRRNRELLELWRALSLLVFNGNDPGWRAVTGAMSPKGTREAVFRFFLW